MCKTGYVGVTCDECHTYPGCKNGYCRNPWECICLEVSFHFFLSLHLCEPYFRRPYQIRGFFSSFFFFIVEAEIFHSRSWEILDLLESQSFPLCSESNKYSQVLNYVQ